MAAQNKNRTNENLLSCLERTFSQMKYTCYTVYEIYSPRNFALYSSPSTTFGSYESCRNFFVASMLFFIFHRKLILNSILLCAAADAGDMSEVTRLLSTTPTSPNVLGLRHKNALHLSSAKGYPEIVELLIMNGVSTVHDALSVRN